VHFSQFTSPTLCVIVGPKKREYYLHKEALISKSPYFSTLLSSPLAGVEVTSGVVTLDSEVDSDAAFQMFVEYLYHSDYNPPREAGRDSRCLLHAAVYVLAERLCMENLKSLALQRMIKEFAKDAYCQEDSWLHTNTIVQLTEIVYENTPDLYAHSNEDEESPPEDQEIISGGRESQEEGPESLLECSKSQLGLDGISGEAHGKSYPLRSPDAKDGY
jgi:BTB/POZ domain